VRFVWINGVVPAALTFGRLAGALPDVDVALHDLVGYADPPPRPYSLAAEVEAVLPLLPAHLLGFSAGGAVALAVAAAVPELVLSLTVEEPAWVGSRLDEPDYLAALDRLMLHTPADARWEPFHELLDPPGGARATAGAGPGAGADRAAGRPVSPAALPTWVADRVDRGAEIWRALRVTELEPAALARYRGRVYLPVAGDSNPRFRTVAERLAAVFPDATVEVYPDCTHTEPPHARHAARFAAALRERVLTPPPCPRTATGAAEPRP
jgi:pimeloyl-ACP methyl ester carboxylesterase